MGELRDRMEAALRLRRRSEGNHTIGSAGSLIRSGAAVNGRRPLQGGFVRRVAGDLRDGGVECNVHRPCRGARLSICDRSRTRKPR